VTTWADYIQRYPQKLGKAAPVFNRSASTHAIAITTRSQLKMPVEPALLTKGLGEEWERRPVADRLEEAERRDAVSVALKQPHKPSIDNPRRSEPLGRFCALLPISTGDRCWQAGQRYAEIVREHKTARGFDVLGWAPSDRGYSGVTPEQLEARRDLAIARKHEADRELNHLSSRLPRVLELLCYDQREPIASDRDATIKGLISLANLWGFGRRRLDALDSPPESDKSAQLRGR
jgi:hypothetical protein